jgi:hypothetical protein
MSGIDDSLAPLHDIFPSSITESEYAESFTEMVTTTFFIVWSANLLYAVISEVYCRLISTC